MKNSKIVIGTDETGVFTIRVRGFILALLMCVCCPSGIIASNGTLCASKTTKGLPCKNNAINGSNHCYFHSESSKCSGKRADGQKCNALHMKDSKYCVHHQNQSK